ncbi:hypothetical protein COU91_00960 [Candidatus Saccharibacteria bacterium CG10_big_fil_rev_8_21_14_0_10_47_8]|nr:MAG: hypothetical protein COU91_00960 [Candidatus Saccharibacteria bacterium CG10_big_fil_rev_8_21_14_0_10_47_8]
MKLELPPKASELPGLCAIAIGFGAMGRGREALSEIPLTRPDGSPYVLQLQTNPKGEGTEFAVRCGVEGNDGQLCEGQCVLSIIGTEDKLFYKLPRKDTPPGICQPQKPAKEDTPE